MAPRDPGSYVITDCPKPGASEIFTDRGIEVVSTLAPKCFADLVGDLVGELGPRRRTSSAGSWRRSRSGFRCSLIRSMLLQQLAEALQRVVLALDRDQHLVDRRHRVDREQAERRRAVDQDVVVVVVDRLDRAFFSRVSRSAIETSSISAPARSMVAGMQPRRGASGQVWIASAGVMSPTSTSYTDGVPAVRSHARARSTHFLADRDR